MSSAAGSCVSSGKGQVDHLACHAVLQLPFMASPALESHCEVFRNLAKSPPCIPFDVGSTSHQYLLDKWMQDCAGIAFPLDHHAKRKGCITVTTYSYIRNR